MNISRPSGGHCGAFTPSPSIRGKVRPLSKIWATVQAARKVRDWENRFANAASYVGKSGEQFAWRCSNLVSQTTQTCCGCFLQGHRKQTIQVRFVLWDDQNWLWPGRQPLKIMFYRKNPWNLRFFSALLQSLPLSRRLKHVKSLKIAKIDATRNEAMATGDCGSSVVGKAVGGKNFCSDIFMLDIYSIYIYIYIHG